MELQTVRTEPQEQDGDVWFRCVLNAASVLWSVPAVIAYFCVVLTELRHVHCKHLAIPGNFRIATASCASSCIQSSLRHVEQELHTSVSCDFVFVDDNRPGNSGNNALHLYLENVVFESRPLSQLSSPGFFSICSTKYKDIPLKLAFFQVIYKNRHLWLFFCAVWRYFLVT